jgi:hypothetical protein
VVINYLFHSKITVQHALNISFTVVYLYNDRYTKHLFMKHITTLLLAVLITCTTAFAQGKPDIIKKLNGEEMKGKISEMTDDAVKFTYDNETLVYTIKKADIAKITFASGRVEVVNDAPDPNASAAMMQDHKNKIAILPFTYINDNREAGDAMSYKVQAEAYNMMKNHSGTRTVQDPTTTNALLIKAGINESTMRGYTMVDICNVLGVELLIQGTVTQNIGTATSYTSQSGNYNNKQTTKGNKGSTYGSSSTSNTQGFKTTILFNVFNDKGENLYSKDHESFWSMDDAYKITLQYLLKRSPVYVK